MRSFNQSKRRRFQHERAINAFERAFSEVDSAAHSRIQAAGAAAATNLGGECSPASGSVGLTEIGAAVAAAPCDSVLFGMTPRDSSSNLGEGECSPSATGTGLSEFGAAIAAASHDSAAVTAPSCDSAIAAAASQDSAVVAATLHDRAVATAALRDSAVVADVGAPATRAAADRLQPSATVGWMSMDDNTGKFFIQFLLTKNHRK
mgnify:CR=1 FL=1